jgi:hypothetical protein
MSLRRAGALEAGAIDDALEAVFREAGFDGFRDVGDGADVRPEAEDAGDAIGRDRHGVVVSCDHYWLI